MAKKKEKIVWQTVSPNTLFQLCENVILESIHREPHIFVMTKTHEVENRTALICVTDFEIEHEIMASILMDKYRLEQLKLYLPNFVVKILQQDYKLHHLLFNSWVEKLVDCFCRHKYMISKTLLWSLAVQNMFINGFIAFLFFNETRDHVIGFQNISKELYIDSSNDDDNENDE